MKTIEISNTVQDIYFTKILSFFGFLKKEKDSNTKNYDLSLLVSDYSRISFNFLLFVIFLLSIAMFVLFGGTHLSNSDFIGIFKIINILSFFLTIITYNLTNKNFQILKILCNIYLLFTDSFFLVLIIENSYTLNSFGDFLRILHLYMITTIIFILFRFEMETKDVILYMVYKFIVFCLLIYLNGITDNLYFFIYELLIFLIILFVIYIFCGIRNNFQVLSAEQYFKEKFQNRYFQNLYNTINLPFLKINYSMNKISFNDSFTKLMNSLGLLDKDIIDNLINYKNEKLSLISDNFKKRISFISYNKSISNINRNQFNNSYNNIRNFANNNLSIKNINSNNPDIKDDKIYNSINFIKKKTIFNNNRNLTLKIKNKNCNIVHNDNNIYSKNLENNKSVENNLLKKKTNSNLNIDINLSKNSISKTSIINNSDNINIDFLNNLFDTNFLSSKIKDRLNESYLIKVNKSKTHKVIQNYKNLNFSERISMKYTNIIDKPLSRSITNESVENISESKKKKFLVEEDGFIVKLKYLFNNVFNNLLEDDDDRKIKDKFFNFQKSDETINRNKFNFGDYLKNLFFLRYDINYNENFQYVGSFNYDNEIKIKNSLEVYYRRVSTFEGECLEFYFNNITELKKIIYNIAEEKIILDIVPQILNRIKLPLDLFLIYFENKFKKKYSFQSNIKEENKIKIKNKGKCKKSFIEFENDNNKENSSYILFYKSIRSIINDIFKEDYRYFYKINRLSNFFNKLNYNNFTFFKISEFCCDLMKVFKKNYKKKNNKIKIKCEFDFDVNSILLYNNEIKIREIIIILLSNCFRYTEKGYVKIKASLLNEKERIVKIEIEDTRGERELEYLKTILSKDKDLYNQIRFFDSKKIKTYNSHNFEQSNNYSLNKEREDILNSYKNCNILTREIGDGLIFKIVSKEKCIFTFNIFNSESLKQNIYAGSNTNRKINEEKDIDFGESGNFLEIFMKSLINKDDSISMVRDKTEKSVTAINDLLSESIDVRSDKDKTYIFSPKNIQKNFENLQYLDHYE